MDADVYDPELAKNKQHTMLMYVAMAVGIIVLIVLMRWIIARINYKMYQVRQNFRPTLTWIGIGLVVLIIASILIFYVLNLIGKQGAYKKHYTADEEDLQRPNG